MTIEQLKKACESRPFQPFIIHVADGRKLTVNSPEFIMTAPTGRTFAIYEGDVVQVVDLLLVTGLEIRPVIGGPGTRRRPRAS
jgi:hypothetical protein